MTARGSEAADHADINATGPAGAGDSPATTIKETAHGLGHSIKCGKWVSFLPSVPSPYADDTTMCALDKGHEGRCAPDPERFERVTYEGRKVWALIGKPNAANGWKGWNDGR